MAKISIKDTEITVIQVKNEDYKYRLEINYLRKQLNIM